jgi:predicted aldo/keto reductase-like oxidoreductase
LLFRNFGKTNENVSILGFGAMRLPAMENDPRKIDEKEAIRMIRYSIDHGVNFIDTAYPYGGFDMYTGGRSEPIVAKALKDGYRERVNISTKLPTWLIDTKEDMDNYLNKQLERLETDVIDFYLIHGITKTYWEKLKKLGFEDFLNQAIEDGKIRYAGFSFHDRVELFKEVVDHYDWSFCLIQYNYLDENYQAGKEGLKYAFNKGLGVATMEPLRGGQIAVNIPEEIRDTFDEAVVKRTPAEWALRWVWNHSEVSVVLSGMSSMEDVRENLRISSDAQSNSLSKKELVVIDHAKKVFNDKLEVGCTGCGYCLPCPQGVDIPENFAKYNDYYLFGTPETKERFKFGYEMGLLNGERASACTECGECEKLCTQEIQIMKELKKVKKLYET